MNIYETYYGIYIYIYIYISTLRKLTHIRGVVHKLCTFPKHIQECICIYVYSSL